MIPDVVRLYNLEGPDLVAVVSTQPAWGKPGMHLIQVARGARSSQLGKGTVFGPYPEAELADRFADVVDGLRAEGFEPTGLAALIEALDDPSPQVRGRAAARFGWRRSVEAVSPLLSALTRAVDDVCPILDALGAIGDPDAIPAVRAQAARKLLSRRRSAVEALRRLGDAEGLAEAGGRALEQLSPPIREPLDACAPDATSGEAVDALVKAIGTLPAHLAGITADTLYELATPPAVAAAVRFLCGVAFDRPYIWRYVKSVYKRALLRYDHATFGRLAHEIEIQARRTKGTKTLVKSGYDGVDRETPIFRSKTQDYMRRLGWRQLRNLARHRPEEYPHAAAEALIPYQPEDAEEPKGLRGAFARCYLLHRILFGAGTRFRLDDRRLVFRFRDAKSVQVPTDRREESFPELWDAQPRAFLRVLGAARLPEAHAFAVRAIAGPHRAVLESASLDEILPLLGAPYEPTVELGLAELRRRFDPSRPDWTVLVRLLADERPGTRTLGRDWLRQTAPLWARDPEWLLAFLTDRDVTTALLAAELAETHLGLDAGSRQTLAGRIVALLRAPESSPGSHDALAKFAREALAAEIGALLSVHELAALASGGTPAVQALAGELLAHRPEAVGALGLEGLVRLAQHEVAAVRTAAHALLRSAVEVLRADLSPLLVLAESEWEDTRSVALALLRDEIGAEALGFEGLMGLLDSNRVDVQDMGRTLVKQRFADLPARVLVERLVQHPHPNMRRFALDLAVQYLPDGAEALAPLAAFFRAAVLDLWPDRLVKLGVVDFLLARGLRDEAQAEVAARLLGEFVRLHTRADSEHALEALVRLTLAYPRIGPLVGLGLRLGGVA